MESLCSTIRMLDARHGCDGGAIDSVLRCRLYTACSMWRLADLSMTRLCKPTVTISTDYIPSFRRAGAANSSSGSPIIKV
jgi:hypothetical protein